MYISLLILITRTHFTLLVPGFVCAGFRQRLLWLTVTLDFFHCSRSFQPNRSTNYINEIGELYVSTVITKINIKILIKVPYCDKTVRVDLVSWDINTKIYWEQNIQYQFKLMSGRILRKQRLLLDSRWCHGLRKQCIDVPFHLQMLHTTFGQLMYKKSLTNGGLPSSKEKRFDKSVSALTNKYYDIFSFIGTYIINLSLTKYSSN